jgi:hypothetical protein
MFFEIKWADNTAKAVLAAETDRLRRRESSLIQVDTGQYRLIQVKIKMSRPCSVVRVSPTNVA